MALVVLSRGHQSPVPMVVMRCRRDVAVEMTAAAAAAPKARAAVDAREERPHVCQHAPRPGGERRQQIWVGGGSGRCAQCVQPSRSHVSTRSDASPPDTAPPQTWIELKQRTKSAHAIHSAPTPPCWPRPPSEACAGCAVVLAGSLLACARLSSRASSWLELHSSDPTLHAPRHSHCSRSPPLAAHALRTQTRHSRRRP